MAGNFCTSCGAPRQGDSRFCTKCGTPFPEEAPHAAPADPAPTPAPVASMPAASVPAVAAPPRKKSKLPLVLGIGCLSVVVLAGVLVGALVLFSADGTTGGGSEFVRYDLSGDQRRVVEEFGLPRTFTIVYGEDVEGALEGGDLETHRIELWDYYEMGTRFVFRDGKVVATREIEPLGGAAFPAISPAQFVSGMTVADVSDSMGLEPAASAQVSTELGEGLEILIWDGVLSCTFENGALIAAETAPVVEEVAQ